MPQRSALCRSQRAIASAEATIATAVSATKGAMTLGPAVEFSLVSNVQKEPTTRAVLIEPARNAATMDLSTRNETTIGASPHATSRVPLKGPARKAPVPPRVANQRLNDQSAVEDTEQRREAATRPKLRPEHWPNVRRRG